MFGINLDLNKLLPDFRMLEHYCSMQMKPHPTKLYNNLLGKNFCYGCGAPVKGLHKCQYCGNNV